jgi:hypothetical protein
METVPVLSIEVACQGPIALEHALFCLDCEVIFTGLASCPRCSGRVVWPLAKWLYPAQPGLTPTSVPAGGSPASYNGADSCRAVA